MKITLSSYFSDTIKVEDGFSNDLFGRKKFGDSLAAIIRQSNGKFTLAITGNWGEGKTTFAKQWQGELSSTGIQSIYIDAFAQDYVDDAFMVLASAINDHLKTVKSSASSKFTEKVKKVGAHLLGVGTKLGIRVATAGILSDDDLKDVRSIGADISKDVGSAAEKYIKERLDNHTKDVATIKDFKETLSELAGTLDEEAKGPFTIIIDELDRCRPSFAVELLEKIKHFFSVENVAFVLVMNRTQLEESIRATYGTNIDAHTYLQKFISIEASIPRNKSEYDSDIPKYCKYLAAEHEMPDTGKYLDVLSAYCEHLALSLREIEKVFTYICIAIGAKARTDEDSFVFCCLAATLKVKNPKLFQIIAENKADIHSIAIGLGCPNFQDDNDETAPHEVKYTLRFANACLMSDEEFKNIDDGYRRIFFGYGGRRAILFNRSFQLLSSFSLR